MAATDDQKTAATDPQQPDSTPSPLGGDQVEKHIADAAASGYFGSRPDPTPLEHYTLPGVLANKPTPETDPATVGRRADQAHYDYDESES